MATDLAPETGLTADNTNSSSALWRVEPRISVGYSGAGYTGTDSFGRFEGFLPLRQTPGRDVTFLEGRLLLDNDANLGSNAILGHRVYSPQDNRLYGGYLAYDTRDTGNKFFQQIGFGFETLGDWWDLRANVYLPVGDRNQQVDVDIVDSGLLLVDRRFQGHSLLLDTFRQRSERRVREAAMSSFDVEGGGRIAKLPRGEIRAYGGLYYLSAPGSPEVLGGRVRLEARPNDFLTLGLGVQTDGLFGTNLLFRIGANFPARSRPVSSDDPPLLARLGDSVERAASIIVDRQEQTQFFQEELTLIARNPATGEPWYFNHVNLGLGSSDGSFESPYGTVAEALATIPTDGNGIVYVAQGTNPGIPAFTIPDRVQVLSRGPVQTLPVLPLQSLRLPPRSLDVGFVQLPFSGSGNFPLVTSNNAAATVTLGNDTVLSGFTVLGDGIPVLLGQNITNARVRDNQLISRNSATHGILLQGIRSQLDLTNNTIAIANPRMDGIRIEDISGTVNVVANAGSRIQGAGINGVGITNGSGRVSLSDFTITQSGNDGIEVEVGDGANLTVELADFTITGVQDDGIGLRAQGTGNLKATILRTAIASPADRGIELDLADRGQIETTITESAVTNPGDSGIFIAANDDSAVNATVSDTTIANAAERGIYAKLDNRAQGTFRFTNNPITNAGNDGILVELDNFARATAAIANNTITNSGGDGIELDADDSTQLQATVTGNTISDTANNRAGIYVQAVAATGNPLVEVTLDSNVINNAGGDGIEIVPSDAARVSATVTNNRIANPRDDGIELNTSDAARLTATVANNQIVADRRN